MRADLERQKPARARAGQIRTGMRTYIETLGLIAVAYREGDHLALGYESWDAYLEGEFNHQRVQLDPAMREKAITELRLGGLSQRAIAVTIGVGRQTVADHERQVALPRPPEPKVGVDGKAVSPARPPVVDALKQAIDDATDRADQHASPAPSRLQRQERTGEAATSPESPEVAASGEEVDGPASSPASSDDPRPDPAAGRGSSHDNLVNTPVGPMSPAVAAAAGVDPHAAWKKKFFDSIVAARKVMRAEVEDVVRLADDEAVDELHRVARDLSSYSGRIAEQRAALHSNVTPIRRAK